MRLDMHAHQPGAPLSLQYRSTLLAADMATTVPPPSLPVEELTRSQASLVAQAMGPEGDLVAGRLARGVRCFIVRIDGGIAGYGWLSAGPEWIGELQLEIKPREREGYIWNCVTLDAHRRQRVYRTLVIGMSLAGGRYGMGRSGIGSVGIPPEGA